MGHNASAFIGAGLFFVASFANCAPASSQDADLGPVQQAQQELQAGNYGKAITITTEVLQKDPGSFPALVIRGFAEEQIGKNDDAVNDLSAATTIRSDVPQVYVGLCSGFYRLHRLDDAISACSKALEGDPNNVAAYDERALAHDAKDDSRNETLAVGDVDRAIALDPKSWWPWAERCELKIELKRENEGAGDDCDQALSLNPHDGWTWYQRGRLYFNAHDFKNAEIALQRSIDNKGTIRYAYVFLGQTQTSLGQYSQAIATLTTFIEEAPMLPDGYIARAEAEEQNHQNAEAIADAKKTLSLKSEPDPYDTRDRAQALLRRLAPSE